MENKGIISKSGETTKWDVLLDLQEKIKRAKATIGYCKEKIKSGGMYLGDAHADLKSAEEVFEEMTGMYQEVLKS